MVAVSDLSAAGFLPPIAGIRIGCARAFSGRADLAVLDICQGANVAGMFTQNAFAAAPVQVCRKNLSGGRGICGLVINAGSANAGTSARGIRDAEESCRMLAAILGCLPEQILPFSTGIIGEYLPMGRMGAGLENCAKNLAADNWPAAARAIMTGDSIAKGASEIVRCGGKSFAVTGIAKGNSMIHPRMATMLAFVATDAAVPRRQLAAWQRAAAATSFNAVSVDGETSTNDSFVLVATGKAGKCPRKYAGKIKAAIAAVCGRLAEAIVRDGKGANRIASITVRGAKTRADCRRVAEAVAKSPLVRMAIAAGKADAGRFLAAAGGGGYHTQSPNIKIGDIYIVRDGGVTSLREQTLADDALAADEANITIELGNFRHAWTIRTCGMTRLYMDTFGLPKSGARAFRQERNV